MIQFKVIDSKNNEQKLKRLTYEEEIVAIN